MGVLHPRTLENQQKIEDAGPEIGKIKGDIDAAYMDPAYNSLRYGFLLGYMTAILPRAQILLKC